jgi:hypothetical protein
MSHTLVLDIPEEAYEELVCSASEKGQDPETIAAKMLAESLADPVMRLAGCLSMPFSDIGDRHDEYIAQAIYEEADRD